MCPTHYRREKLGLQLDAPVKQPGRTTCKLDGCDKLVAGQGLCGQHYQRLRAGSPMEGDRRFKPELGCKVEGCERPHAAKGFCMAHWRRDRDGLDITAPIVSKLVTDDLALRLRTYAPEGGPDECWEWTRATNKGYGAMAVHGSRMRQAHVVAWELHHGKPLPQGKILRHTCDNPPCTNPAHLIIGKHSDNVRDKVERDRQSKGSAHGLAKNTEDAVLEICRLYEAGAGQQELARQFGISQAAVSLILQGKTWGHVTGRGATRSRLYKMDAQKAAEMRRMYTTGAWTQRRLAEHFGVSKALVNGVVSGRMWV